TLTHKDILKGNTQYQLIVSSSVADASGNQLGNKVTWTFTTGSNQWVQNPTSGLGSGTNSGTMATSTGVQLAPALSDDFPGNALSPAWTTTSWGGNTSVTVAGSILSVGSAEVLSVQSFTNAPVEGSINFGATPYQHFGMATDLSSVNGNYWVLFS